jgi:hypothetical protein
VNTAESIQTNFARAVLGLQGQRGVSNVFVRAELGLEKLESRWEKLRLGYWRRIQVAQPSRALVAVARARRWQLMWGGAGIGRLGWMRGTRQLLNDRGMADYWSDPAKCAQLSKIEWEAMVYDKVEAHYEAERENEVALLPSLSTYVKVKSWKRMDKDRAEFKGEIGELGALVVERYVDEIRDRLGGRLKLLCRAGCLPVMARVAWELGVNREQGQCMMCRQGEEDIEHVFLSCQAYSKHRERLLTSVGRSYSRGNNGANILEAGAERVIEVLLGASAGCKLTEDEVDRATKRFLRKAWKARREVTAAVNQEFGRMDVQWMAREPGWYQPKPTGHTTVKRVYTRKAKLNIVKAAKDSRHCPAVRVLPGIGDGRGKGARRKLILV